MAHVPLGFNGVVPAVPNFPQNSTSSSQQPIVYLQRDTIAMQGVMQGDGNGPQSPTKEMLWTENQALQQHLSWTQHEADKQIHYTKEVAAHKLENALHGYANEFRSTCVKFMRTESKPQKLKKSLHMQRFQTQHEHKM